MDKSTLSNYGWVVIVTLVLAVMLALATPFGDYVAKGASNVIKTFANTSDDAIDEDNIQVQSEKWDDYLNDTEEVILDYSPEEIESDPLLLGIGKTRADYVVAVFNEDKTSVTISKNGANSDGKMMDWNEEEEGTLSPFYADAETTLTEVIINEGIVNVGDEAFWACQEINKITFPQSLIEIGRYGFSSMTYYTDKLVLPKNLETIGNCAFESCNFSSVTLPSSVKTIGDYAFQDCDKLTELIIPDGVTTLGRGFARQSLNLTKVKFGKNITEIPREALSYCEKLSTVIFPQNLKVISPQAFEECVRLENVVLPQGITTIDELAFKTTSPRIADFNIYLPKTITTIKGFAFYCSGGRFNEFTIYCETQTVADLVTNATDGYNPDNTDLIVDATKFK